MPADIERAFRAIERYHPVNEQEYYDRAQMLDFLRNNEDAFLRSNLLAHMTASAWIVNPGRSRVLMVYHRLYDSWSWTGGHCDGDTDFLRVAVKEAMEETGLKKLRVVSDEIYSLETLTVDGHIKKGEYVPSHLHFNVTYLLEADEDEPLHICEGENSAVRWFDLEEALRASTEPWFVENIYKKLNRKLSLFPAGST